MAAVRLQLGTLMAIAIAAVVASFLHQMPVLEGLRRFWLGVIYVLSLVRAPIDQRVPLHCQVLKIVVVAVYVVNVVGGIRVRGHY